MCVCIFFGGWEMLNSVLALWCRGGGKLASRWDCLFWVPSSGPSADIMFFLILGVVLCCSGLVLVAAAVVLVVVLF